MRLLLFLLIALCTSLPLFAQKRDRQALEREKKKNIEQLNELREVLKKTSSEKQVSISQLKALSAQIDAQSKQINLLSDEIRLSEVEISDLRKASQVLNRDLDKLRAEYAQMIYAADKRRQQLNPLGFLFSSENFNQLVARFRYLKQYAKARQTQKREMETVQTELTGKRTATEQKRRQQTVVLTTKVRESEKLEDLKQDKNKVVEQLSQREGVLRAELAESRKNINRLENMITSIIAREARERAERAARERAERERLAKAEAARLAAERREAERKRAEAVAKAKEEGKPAPPPVVIIPNPDLGVAKSDNTRTPGNLNREELALGSSFAASRARLPWPVQRGFVSERFGVHPHPVLKGLKVSNPGIDIQTNAGEPVRAIYDGIVMNVEYVMGSQNVVAIQHGDYYTIYAKLKNVTVKMGDRVKARETIGTVGTDNSGNAELQFQIWKEFAKMNPEAWLAPR
ncbi:murein hydrolase activator EnvC family protein [Fibrella forsythiae]|uniref:Peptidoglycan DD-metalloendopeptidase family protein n=1 Tax=Fibrella forsythiae TaxID=2817061 RepID=A0ABS3JK52_9BACT|nr:peptidoglycan DD-metalloendopeptidase family protein [Fibrella forsythiae]MBO0949619.1 peptidoglycan DD-metalloendopeptidase family protein [Fibrella forsythiae]